VDFLAERWGLARSIDRLTRAMGLTRLS
jgi:hypothetical protein